MNNQSSLIVPRESCVIELINVAKTRGQYLITDGKDTLVSPKVLPGWFRIGVRVKQPKKAAA